MTETWIVGATLVTQNDKREVISGHVRIVDRRIDSITRKLPRRFKRGTKVIQVDGLHLFPGFIQTHVHLCQTLFRNQADDMELLDWLSQRIWPLEAAHTEATLHTSALLGIHELLSSGTTCILDMGTVRHTSAILEAVKISGIRASVGKCLMDHPETTPSILREKTTVALTEAQDLFERWNGSEDDRIRISFAPRFAVSCTDSLLREVAHLSASLKTLVHTHTSENRKEIELVKKLTGKENVLYLDSVGLASPRLVAAHGVWLSSAEVQTLQKTGTHITHCPSSNLKLASGRAPVPQLLRAGINVGLGADGAPCNNNLNIFNEMRLASLIHKPENGPKTLRAAEVLDLATRNGARALGWWDAIGSIEEGKKADLVAVDLRGLHNHVADRGLDLDAIASALVYASGPSDVRSVWVDGRLVSANGQVSSISTPTLLKGIQKAQKTFSFLR